MIILSIIQEYREQKKKAKNVLRELSIPQSVHYMAADRINRPGRRRAARWAEKTPALHRRGKA